MKPVWIIDADGIEAFGTKNHNVYINRKVEAFLYEEKKFGIAAVKGLGKTFFT